LFVWLVIFAAVFKGPGSSSYIVWATVPLPTLFILIMIIKGATLEGAKDGYSMYLKGTPGQEFQQSVWADAAG